MKLVVDTESDGLKFEATRLWCAVALDVETRERYEFTPDNIDRLPKLLESADLIIGHNWLGHDDPLIKKLYPDYQSPEVLDTFILSSLLKPDRAGHSIEYWGERLARQKPSHEDWTQYSEEMLHRCSEDTEINLLVYKQLIREMGSWDWSDAIELEHDVARYHAIQEMNGVLFDVNKARTLYAKIKAEIDEILCAVDTEIPPKPVQVGTVIMKPFTLAGALRANVAKFWEDDLELVGGPHTRIEWKPFNLGSPVQVKEYFLAHGWIPTEWNYKKDGKRLVYDEGGSPIKSSPKLTEDSYHTIDSPLPKLVSRYFVLKHRLGMIYSEKADGTLGGFINSLRPDGRIPAEGVPQATSTGRYRHKTIVNIPKASPDVVYGAEIRELFTVPADKVMLGCDAKALEARVEGHYTYVYDGGDYAKDLLEGDPHTKNMEIFSQAANKGISRDLAKNGKYALTYGAQPSKLADTLGIPSQISQKVFDAFWRENEALGRLRSDVIAVVRSKGFLRGLDGRKLFIRSEHSALNLLFQSAGSVLVKKATVLVNKELIRRGIEYKQVIHMHDEFQLEISPEDADEVEQVCLDAFVEAGEWFKASIKIEGDVKIGRNWKETH